MIFICQADAQIHGILPYRGGTSATDTGVVDEERRERVRSLSAAALAVVEQALENPELFEGMLCPLCK